jgi:hypothetical protein
MLYISGKSPVTYKSQGVTDGGADSSEAPPKNEVVKPVISINLQPEQSVVQQLSSIRLLVAKFYTIIQNNMVL